MMTLQCRSAMHHHRLRVMYVLLVVNVGDVNKQNKHQNQLIHSMSMRIPIGISLFFSLLSFLNALYTLSGASVRWIDGVLVVVVD